MKGNKLEKDNHEKYAVTFTSSAASSQQDHNDMNLNFIDK